MTLLAIFLTTEESLGAFVALVILGWLAVQAYRRWVPDQPDADASPVDIAVENEPGSATSEQPLCLRCLTPYEPAAYFCPHCNAAVGPYNNWMPYLHIYSEGQWLRSAGAPPPRNPWLIRIGYALLTLAVLGPLAPILWVCWPLMSRPSPAASLRSTDL